MTRIVKFSAVLALVAAACGGAFDTTGTIAPPAARGSTATEGGAPVGDSSEAQDPDSSIVPAVGVLPSGPSALDDMRAGEFPQPLVDPGEILSGGPPPDGIPPIEDPQFLPVASSLDLLQPGEPVVALEINGDARAYPVQVMIWHEIVNDTVGGVPVAVTYCPLCNSAVSYERRIRGVETTFGTSGRLFASALVMYDRATESLWTHYDGRSVIGVLTGEQLEPIASPLMAWSEFRSAYPDGLVLDPAKTGFVRSYGLNPYAGYDEEDNHPFLFRGPLDDRARAMQRVVGVSIGEAAKAYSLELVSGGEANATNDTIGDEPVVILWKAGQSTALDNTEIARGRDVGSVGVFVPVVDGRLLTFSSRGGVFVDAETGSTWSVAGEAVAGALNGRRLERIPHLDTFWFAWSTYQPGTELIEAA